MQTFPTPPSALCPNMMSETSRLTDDAVISKAMIAFERAVDHLNNVKLTMINLAASGPQDRVHGVLEKLASVTKEGGGEAINAAVQPLSGTLSSRAIEQRLVANNLTHSTKLSQIKAQLNDLQERHAAQPSCAAPVAGDKPWAGVAQTISDLKKGYLDRYAEYLLALVQLYDEYTSQVTEAVNKGIVTPTSGGDANKLTFNAQALTDAYTAFKKKVTDLEKGLKHVPNYDKMSQEQKDNIASSMAPAFRVEADGAVKFNFENLNYESYPPGTSATKHQAEMSMAAYQAWQAAFNPIGAKLQSNMQAFSERYNQANSTFDNMNKVLSTSIASLIDCLKEIARALA